MAKKLSPVQLAKMKKIMSDPVLWARAFLVATNAATKTTGPWEARDYQQEMMRDTSIRKVYRCGRRTGKSETMVVEGLHKAFTHKNFRILYITPYENQVNLLFMRMRELIHDSPLVKCEVVKMKNSPYTIEFKNGSAIMGFTTGASSGSGAASVRGQRADWLFLDELDYMGPDDYSTVSMIAGERADIGMTCSSTPTGKRGTFYQMCTDPSMGYSAHFHPSMDNPNWNQEMEDRYRAELTAAQYEHEILAEFGTEEAGVFSKEDVDNAIKKINYYYNPITSIMQREKPQHAEAQSLIYNEIERAPYNPFRCIGVDWDAYAAGSSLLVLDYNQNIGQFQVIKTVEVPRGEYTLDRAVQWVIRLNEIYRPSWIFCDRGYGDFQIERLHIYGDEHPESGLKNKVIGWQFKQSIDVMDPITREMHKEPVKQFMVNQLKLSFERNRMILSEYDDHLYKQLIDYCVVNISQSGLPVYTSENEHFVDALGLAHLAFVLKFPKLTQAIKLVDTTTRIEHSNVSLGLSAANRALRDLDAPIVNPWKDRQSAIEGRAGYGPNERRGDYQQWIHVPLGQGKIFQKPSSSSWGRRGGSMGGRTLW